MSAPGLSLQGVRVSYGANLALDIERLEISPGESVAVVGPSGAGKTTLLRTLGAALRPAAGRVSIGDRCLATFSASELREARADIGFIHQNLGLIPNLRVLHNVLFGRLGRTSLFGSLRMVAWPPATLVGRVHEILEDVGIGAKLYERTDRLSGGEQQRVAVARALFQHPRTLLADEPVASVDPARARATIEMLVRVSRDRGLTLCASLHNIELARAHFDRLIGLRGGVVVFDRRPDEIDAGALDALYDLDADG